MRSFSFHLYVLLCLFLFSSYIIDMNAQNNVPKVTCIYCGGTGRAGYSFCLFCGGSGLMVDPQYQNQKAADYGKSLGLCLRGQMKLIEGDYSEAFDAFREAMRLENAEAMFFVGACCELGMGVDVDLDLAKECYSLGSEYGNLNAKQAIERINRDGYWPATDQVRQSFRTILKTQIEIRSNAAMMNRDFNNNWDSKSSKSTNNYGSCPNCHGTGRCTMCAGRGEWRGNDGKYFDCSICHGGGQCPSCHGSLKLR